MTTALATNPAPCPATIGESLTVRQWAKLMVPAGLSKNEAAARRNLFKTCDGTSAVVRGVGGCRTMARVVAFTELPEQWRVALTKVRDQRFCRSFADALRPAVTWSGTKKINETTAHNEALANARRAVLRIYLGLLDSALAEQDAVRKACAAWPAEAEARNAELPATATPLPLTISERTLRRLRVTIAKRGGIDYAPDEAYGHGRSVAHVRGRIEAKLVKTLGLTEAQLDELIAEVKDRSRKGEHLSSVHQSLEVMWMMGEQVPGLGARRGSAAFPVTKDQMRGWMCSTGARRLSSHGEARYHRECAPWTHRDTSTLRPLELIVLDDTRLDLIATDDRNGARLVELKAYVLMDVATRRILGFTVLDGPIGKEDVRALLARALRAHGLPEGFPMRILFERGTIACSDAAETLLTSIWPGKVEVHRTSMDGAKRSTVADFWQSGSGHWMGKSWIESFMRTLAILLEQLPGQRGAHYTMQPAQLGLKGRDHATNLLRYDKGHGAGPSTMMHEQAITGFADLALRWVESVSEGREFDPRERLKARVLMPKRWVIEQFARNVAWYNATTDHRRAGFERIEELDEKGAIAPRMESSDERWARLSAHWPAQRIHPADAARLLKYSGKTVKVCARKGVVFDEYPFRGLQFWRPDSLACHAAAQLVTQEKKFVALYDPEAIRQAAHTGDLAVLEVHILGDVSAEQWKPGDAGRYIETLPLYAMAGALDPAALAQQAADKQRVVKRQKLELVQAVGPSMLRAIRDLEHDEQELRGVVVKMDYAREQLAESALGRELSDGRADAHTAEPQSRRAAQDPAARELAALQAAHAPHAPEAGDDSEPEII